MLSCCQIVGNFIEFGKDQCGFIADCYKKYGPCYSMGMMGQNLTFLVGPDVSAAFFAATDEELSQPEVYGFMKPVFGANVVYDAPPKVRKQQMSHMTQGLATARLKSYVPMIVAETEQFFREKWGDSGEVDILEVRNICACHLVETVP
jgi:sterol 14alpha-demethylase